MIAYVAGPYSGNIEGNIRAARAVSILLWEKGYTVYCAHLNEAHFEKDSKCTWDDFMQGNLEILLECDLMVLLPHWEKSRGARIEQAYAETLSLPIYEWPNVPPPEHPRPLFNLMEEKK